MLVDLTSFPTAPPLRCLLCSAGSHRRAVPRLHPSYETLRLLLIPSSVSGCPWHWVPASMVLFTPPDRSLDGCRQACPGRRWATRCIPQELRGPPRFLGGLVHARPALRPRPGSRWVGLPLEKRRPRPRAHSGLNHAARALAFRLALGARWPSAADVPSATCDRRDATTRRAAGPAPWPRAGVGLGATDR